MAGPHFRSIRNGRVESIEVSQSPASPAVGRVQVRLVGHGVAEIVNLQVSPQHRRQHFGSTLVQRAVTAARTVGATRIELEARPGDQSISPHALVSMYQRLGFRPGGLTARGTPLMRWGHAAPIAHPIAGLQPARHGQAAQPSMAARPGPGAHPGSVPEVLRRPGQPSVPAVYRPATGGRLVQRAAVAPVTADPTGFRFLHHTISTHFSSGATPDSPGDQLDRVVRDIERGATQAMAFPPLPIFTIEDLSGDLGSETFSLSNRRLYVFKSANVRSVKVRRASLAEVVASLWKMTNESGGYEYPKLTKFGNKEIKPGGLLGKFRDFCEKYKDMPTFAQMAINNFNFH